MFCMKKAYYYYCLKCNIIFFLASNSNNDIPKCLYYCLRTLYKGLVYSFHPCNWKNYTLAQLLTGVVLIKSIVFILKHSLPG